MRCVSVGAKCKYGDRCNGFNMSDRLSVKQILSVSAPFTHPVHPCTYVRRQSTDENAREVYTLTHTLSSVWAWDVSLAMTTVSRINPSAGVTSAGR